MWGSPWARGAGAWCACGARADPEERRQGGAARLLAKLWEKGRAPRCPPPSCLIFSEQTNFADLGARPSWMFQVTHPIPELRDQVASCLFMMLHQNLE